MSVQGAVIAPRLQAAHRGLRLHVANALVVRALLLFARLVHVVVRGAEQAALQRALVEQDGVLHVVAVVTHDGHDGVLAVGVLLVVDVLHVAAFDQRHLPVVQHHPHLVNARREIGGIQRHRLLALTARKVVARRRVVLRKHDLVAHDAENERRVDFHVRGFPGNHVPRKHGNERALRLVRIQILNDGLTAGQRIKIGRPRIQFANAIHAAGVRYGDALGGEPSHQLRPRVIAALYGFNHFAPGVTGTAFITIIKEHGAAQAPAVREELQLVVRNVPAPARVTRNERVAAIQEKEPQHFIRIAERAHPRPVHKHLGQLVQVRRAALFQQFHGGQLAQPPNERQRRARFRNVGRNCQVLLQPDVGAVGAVGGVNDAPLRPVQVTRPRHFGAGIHRQIHLAQVRYERVVRQAVQVLHDALHLRFFRRANGPLVQFGFVVRLDRGRPLALERLLEPRLNEPLAENFVVVVGRDDLHDLRADKFVAVAPVFDLLVQLQTHVVHVRVVIRAEQVEHEGARHFHALVLETVAVRGTLRVY